MPKRGEFPVQSMCLFPDLRNSGANPLHPPLGDQLPVMNQGFLQSGVVKDVEGLKYGIQCMSQKFCGGDFNLSTSGLYFTSV